MQGRQLRPQWTLGPPGQRTAETRPQARRRLWGPSSAGQCGTMGVGLGARLSPKLLVCVTV